MMILTLFLYFKNYFALLNAFKNKSIKYSYIKIYKGDVPEYIEVLRQTLKNQFELPIFFYFLVLFIILFDNFTQLDLILAWIFVISRYLHCYINIPDTSGRDSLFQAEARRCKEILSLIENNKENNHFCIFDELYSGTNPIEAVATSYSYLKYINEF